MDLDEQNDEPPNTAPEPTDQAAPPLQAHAQRRRTRRRARRPPLGRYSFTTELAAAKLDLAEAALRQRARRCSRLENGRVVARLGMGVVGRKFGTTWRFFFEDEDKADAT